MKALLALLLLGLILGFGYWKNENPDATLADFRSGADSSIARLKDGFEAVKAGGPQGGAVGDSQEALNARLDSIESELVETQRAADPSVVNGRLAEAEDRISASETQLSDALKQLGSSSALVSTLEQKSNSTAELANNALNQASTAEQLATKIEQQATETSQKLANAEQQLDVLKTGLETLGAEVNEVSASKIQFSEQLENINKQVDEYASSLATASAESSSVNSSLGELKAQIASIQNEQTAGLENQTALLASMQEKIDAYDARINTLSFDASNGQAEAVASLTAQIDQRIASVESKLQTTNSDSQRISLLENKLQAANTDIQRIAQLEAKLDSANTDIQRIAQLEAKLESANTDIQRIAQLEAKLESTETKLQRLTELETKLAATENELQRVNSLQEELKTSSADTRLLESISNELSASRVRMSAMESEAGDIGQKIVQLTQSIDSIKAQAGTSVIDEQQNAIRSQLEQLQAQLDSAQLAKPETSNEDNPELVALMSELQATRNRIQTLEQRVVELPETAGQDADTLSAQNALQQQIKELERKIQESGGAIDPELASTISAVEEKVSEIASKGYVTQEELRAQQTAKSIEYKIYFDRNSTGISDDAAEVLNSFIAQEKNRTTGISIFGFTDRRGSASYNQQLALQRAANVRSYLIQKGFSFTKIKSISGLGEDAAAVDLEDGAEDAQQRFVVIYADQP